jgi:uncharacterized protein (DUF427 family)
MVRVTLFGETLAESKETIVVEGNHYFPPDSVNKTLFTDSGTSSVCPWKGLVFNLFVRVLFFDFGSNRNAAYYSAEIAGKTAVNDVAWSVVLSNQTKKS